MSGLDPNTENDAASGQAPVANQAEAQGAAVDPAEFAKLKQELDKYQAEAQRARDEAAKSRIKSREESEARQKALAEQGEFKALAETQASALAEMRAQIAELEALKEKASAFDSWQERELAQIDAAAKNLPAEAQAALAAAGTLEAKRAFLNALNVRGPSAMVRKEAASGAAASGSPATDFANLSGRALVEAIKQNPDAYWSQKSPNTGSGPASFLGRQMAARRK